MSNITELSSEQRRVFVDTVQLYSSMIDIRDQLDNYRGGMTWKTVSGKDYLYKTHGRRGQGKSLGVRSEKTELIHDSFHGEKERLSVSLTSLKEGMVRQSKMAVAVGINRMPTVPSQILRLLSKEKILGDGMFVLGSHALYAYEAAAGVFVGSALMETRDIDLLYNVNSKIKLSHSFKNSGLIGLLEKADKTFKLAGKGHYRAVNDDGFMVELVKMAPDPPSKVESQHLASPSIGDLTAVEMQGLKWLNSAPLLKKMLIGGDGVPLEMVVPDPRYFALNKLWISQKEDRDPIKRPRDLEQAKVIANIAVNYLNLKFDDSFMRVFPKEIRNLIPELIAFAEQIKDPSREKLLNDLF